MYDALTRVAEFADKDRDQLDAIVRECELAVMMRDEELFLQKFVKVLKPLADSLDILQGEAVPAQDTYYLP